MHFIRKKLKVLEHFSKTESGKHGICYLPLTMSEDDKLKYCM